MKKVIFFDIDGTLVSEKTGEIPESAVNAIHKAQKNGHIAVINTGRCFSFVEKNVKEIGFDAFVCGCGTYVQCKGQDVFHQTLTSDIIQKLITDLRKCRIDAVLEGMECSYFDVPEKIHTKEFLDFSRSLNCEIKTWEEEYMQVDKFFMFCHEKSDYETFYERHKEDFFFINRENGYYEVVPRGCTKATGMERLLQHLDMKQKDTIAIGDSNNDLQMLEYAAISVGMGVSSEGVREKADFITKEVEENGIEYAMKHFGLLDRTTE